MSILHTFVILAYKESIYLEDCIKSVLNQSYKSEIVIATSTPNKYITSFVDKYKLTLIVNSEQTKGIGYDFDFALSCSQTDLVTIAHQDDLYEEDYAKKIIDMYKIQQDALIIFSDYFEIRDEKKVYTNSNLRIKRFLFTLVKQRKLSKFKVIKRSCIAFGNAICCPAVTFVMKNIPYTDVFATDMLCNIDWYAWERLSKARGRFVFLKEYLMGHRVHEDSTTSEIISNNIRTKEDLQMFEKFWPSLIAKFINHYYIKSEKSNKI